MADAILDPKVFKDETSLKNLLVFNASRDNPHILEIDRLLLQFKNAGSSEEKEIALKGVVKEVGSWQEQNKKKLAAGTSRRADPMQRTYDAADAELKVLRKKNVLSGGGFAKNAPYLSSGREYKKGPDGKFHNAHQQVYSNSCGPCAVKMIVLDVTGKVLAEEYTQDIAKFFEGGGRHDWEDVGTWGGDKGTGMANVLKRAGVPKAKITVGQSLFSFLSQASEKTPLLAVVEWDNKGLHYVVVGKKLPNGNRLIKDPWYGIQESNGISYSPKDDSGNVSALGKFIRWVCTTG